MTTLVEQLVKNNTFLTMTAGVSEFTPKEDIALDDLGYFDTARRKQQIQKKMKIKPTIGA